MSRRGLAWLVRGAILLPALPLSLLIFGLLGAAVSPYDAAGDPVLLTGDMLATREYRLRAAGWRDALRGLYLELYALLETGGGDLYGDAAAASDAVGRARALAEAVAVAPEPPPAMAGLYEDAGAAAGALLDAARLAALWVGSPTADARAAAESALAGARERLVTLEGNAWLRDETTARTEPTGRSWSASGGN